MELQFTPVDQLWSDFTKVSSYEEALSLVEDAFMEINKNRRNTDFVLNFLLNREKYKIRLYDESITEVRNFIDYFKLPAKVVDQIKTYFGIKEPFIVIESENGSIPKDQVKNLSSLLLNAANNSLFSMPVFIPIDKSEKHNIVGFRLGQNYYRRMISELKDNNDGFKTISDVINSYCSLLGTSVDQVRSSSRHTYCISSENYPRDDFNFESNAYFIELVSDPVSSISLTACFSESEYKDSDLDIGNADNYFLHVDYNFSARPSSMVRLVGFLSVLSNMREFVHSNHEKSALLMIDDLFNSKDTVSNEKSKSKGAPKGSLIYKLANMVLYSEDEYMVCALWDAFLKRIRYNVDRNKTIPLLTSDICIDDCLIYQKLQIINLCMQRKYDEKYKKYSDRQETDILLSNGKKLIIPPTQIIPSRTSDQVEESMTLMQNTSLDLKDKVYLQSSQLKSDIASFKYENPDSTFEDFIRWYSPSDVDQSTGQLSSRMKDKENNIWYELFEKGKPCEISKQDPLFNVDAQIEIALDFLNTITPYEFLEYLIPVIFSNVYIDVVDFTREKGLMSINKANLYISRIKESHEHFVRGIRNNSHNLSPKAFSEYCLKTCHDIEDSCAKIFCLASLNLKFPNQSFLIDSLEEYQCFYIPKSRRDIIHKLLEFTRKAQHNPESSQHVMLIKANNFINRIFVHKNEKTLLHCSSLCECY